MQGTISLILAVTVVLTASFVGMSRVDAGQPPGAVDYSPELKAKLEAALQAKGRKYEARTKHKEDDGKPLYTNRLILENSPYLLQHAHNPVNWYPWGDEAFEKARELKRPVFMSVGYSTCHWCHVMEEESFEDVEIATYINEHYIAIKLDRERRPDIDQIYMGAVQALTGSGGWPMTVMMTPDRKPFFGGTYFPPRDGDRGARIGFLTLLQKINERYQGDPEEAIKVSESLTAHLLKLAKPQPAAGVPPASVLLDMAKNYEQVFDEEYGGHGMPPAPKFPRPCGLDLLLRVHRRTEDPKMLRQVDITLDHMMRGGIYDHLAGGFHRYSVDRTWLVPHFEKMLYDQAQLVTTYLEAYQVTGNAEYRRIVQETLDYILREMRSPEGMFYSATDADSMTPTGKREEGYCFTWTPAELKEALTPAEYDAFTALYPVTDSGNFEGRNILHTPRPLAQVAHERKVDPAAFSAQMRGLKDRLLQIRNKRPQALLDDKVLVAWNGLAISAFAQAGFVLSEPRYTAAATRATDAIISTLLEHKGTQLSALTLRRVFREGQVSHSGLLPDHAFFIRALLDVFTATTDIRYLTTARSLTEVVEARFRDPEAGGYFTSPELDLLFRKKPIYDGAIPTANSTMIDNLLRLHTLTLESVYRKRAESALAAFSTTLTTRLTSLPKMACALDRYYDTPKEVAVVLGKAGPGGSSGTHTAFRAVFSSAFLPNSSIVFVNGIEPSPGLTNQIPWLAEKVALDGKTTAYVCENQTCLAPARDAATLAEQVRQTRPYPQGERPQGERPQGEPPQGERPQGESQPSDSPRSAPAAPSAPEESTPKEEPKPPQEPGVSDKPGGDLNQS